MIQRALWDDASGVRLDMDSFARARRARRLSKRLSRRTKTTRRKLATNPRINPNDGIPMKIDRREKLIWRYLLGELAEADHTALEQELLIDRGKFDQVWAVENELVDSYVRGEMYRPARERFESHYLASPLHRERVAIAESFLGDIDQAARETVEVTEAVRKT
jgi:hypothetical protein